MQGIARAHPNIALIKYWGKRDATRNLPAVGSISITLDELWTTMRVALDSALPQDRLTVDGEPAATFLPRVSRCLDEVMGADRPRARVASECNFPIAAGLASSAAAFAALVVAADAAADRGHPTAGLARLAGRASGSAARSLYGGFVELANAGDDIEVKPLRAAADWPLRVVAAVTSEAPKAVGSTEAMETSRRTSPFYGRWLEQQAEDLDAARDAIAARDFERLAAVAEHNCLKMHSVMWASRPPLMYWNRVTIDCMETVRNLQDDGVAVFFTIDAGPQVKAVCTADAEPRVAAALGEVQGVRRVIAGGLGAGASRLADG
jgi:diphosphomevalonate decarboxylase